MINEESSSNGSPLSPSTGKDEIVMPTSPDTNETFATIPSPEGDKKGVNATLLAMLLFWSTIGAYSYLVSLLVPNTRWYEMCLHYVAVMAAFYVWHWQAHRRIWWLPFNKRCFELHMEHHWKVYPPQHYFGRNDGQALEVTHESFVTHHEALLYVQLIGILAIAHYGFHEEPLAIVAAFIMDGLIGYYGNALHQSFHVKGHWLERFDAFHELRAVHYVHHLGSTKINYAVFNIGLDWMLGSLLLEKPKARGEESDQIRTTRQQMVSRVGSLITIALGLQAMPRANVHKNAAIQRGAGSILVRAALVAALLAAWFESERRLTTHFAAAPKTKYPDRLFDLIPESSNPGMMLNNYGMLVDGMVLSIFAMCIFGHSVRPFLALSYAFMLRQGLTLLGAHSSPASSHWGAAHSYPGYFVRYENAEAALSGGILILMVFTAELRSVFPRLVAYGFGAVSFALHVYMLISLRAEYTVDIVLSAIIGQYVCVFAKLIAPWAEGFLP